jgi:hypothetical protein
MYSPQDFAPRRYYVDNRSQRVLVGLTVQETAEFELLDCLVPNDVGTKAVQDDRGPALTINQAQRWLELYRRHDAAWKTWLLDASSPMSVSA